MRLPCFDIAYDLSPGFSVIPGTTRMSVDGGPHEFIDPERSRKFGSSKPHSRSVIFAFPDTKIPAGKSAVLRFRAKVGSAAQEGTRAISTANANSGIYRSNEAVVSVNVSGGVMSNDAFVAGKVFFDRNGNGQQDVEEVGVPSVRIYLEDGSFVDTDADGKYSLYGLKPLTHVLKLDPATIPLGMTPVITSNRNAGQAGSLFLDLKNGELGRADFALNCGTKSCGQQVMTEIASRQAASKNGHSEINTVLKRPLDYENRDRDNIDVRALPANGMLDPTGSVSPSSTQQEAPTNTPKNAVIDKENTQIKVPEAKAQLYSGNSLEKKEFEKLLQKQNGRLGFIGLCDGEQLASKQASIRVTGQTDKDFILRVNGSMVSQSRVGARSAIKDRHIAAWEYVSVSFQTGRNVLELEQDGSAPVSMTVLVAGEARSLQLETPDNAVADGKSLVAIKLRLLDAMGLLVPGQSMITIASNAGVWQLADLDNATEGVQVMLENGAATLMLMSPATPATSVIHAAYSGIDAQHKLVFLPELRPMIATGIVEGVINLRSGSIESAAAGRNGFERELRQFSHQSDDGKLGAAARAAFFLKGKVKGDYLLTAAYDSEKEVRDRLFRDIEPDKYYPIYGDSSVRGFDAQTSGKMYIRIDKEQSYLLYGDLPAETSRGVRQLTQYNRSLSGAKYHFEKGAVKANVFASHDNLTQRKKEFAANGTSGPFRAFDADYIENSEQVEIISRDDAQSAVTAKRLTLTRNVDYEVELESGMLLFTSPQPSLDENGHQRVIRITYEADGSGKQSWLYGADVALVVTDNVTVGAVAVEDKNPTDPRSLHGITAQVALGANTMLSGELAQTSSPIKDQRNAEKGNGARIALNHDGERFKGKASMARTDRNFDNISASVSGDYDDSRASGEFQRDDGSVIKTEAIRTKDHRVQGGVGDITANLSGAMVGIEKQVLSDIKLAAGVRVVRGTEATTEEGSRDVALNTVRGRCSNRDLI